MEVETPHSGQNMQPLLRVEKLVKCYERQRVFGSREKLLALDGVSFAVAQETTLAVVGESGSGKSTLGFCISCLEIPTSGSIWFEGRDIVVLAESERRKLRPQIQLIFQDPSNSLNPRWSVEEILLEPLNLQGQVKREETKQRAVALMTQVGLSSDMFQRSPAQLSGGQRQRLAIARALALEPKLLILDEALSALDCSVQAQIANLLIELQRTLRMTYLLITHDLAMAAHLADEIVVMDRGRVVEQGPAQNIVRHPKTETTQHLLAAMPSLDNAERPPLES
jgi:ABC-type glutathione transport system ATPase component